MVSTLQVLQYPEAILIFQSIRFYFERLPDLFKGNADALLTKIQTS